MIGHASFELKDLIPSRNIRIEKILDNSDPNGKVGRNITGSITFTVVYTPLISVCGPQSSAQTTGQVFSDLDILHHVAFEELLNNDILPKALSGQPTAGMNKHVDVPPTAPHSPIFSGLVGVLVISAIHCRNIRLPPSQGSKAIQSPFVTMKIGDVAYSTREQKKSFGDPFFSETFSFILRDPIARRLSLSIQVKVPYQCDSCQ